MADQGSAVNAASALAITKAGIIPPSPICKVKCDFGKKQTGYLSRENLMAFLKNTFPEAEEFAAQVILDQTSRCNTSTDHFADHERAMDILCTENS